MSLREQGRSALSKDVTSAVVTNVVPLLFILLHDPASNNPFLWIQLTDY